MSHGVMLSDPPLPLQSSSSSTSSASAAGGARAASTSTLLHKGVMLSLRPTSSVLDPQGQRGGPGLSPPPFITGGRPHDQFGYPPIQNPALILHRKRISAMAPAMRRHRRWLDDLRRERDRLDDDRRRQMDADQIRLRNFKERSSFVRRRICEAIKGGGNELTPEEAERLFTAPLSELKKQQPAPTLKSTEKPAWSMTEDEGDRATRAQIEDLIEFTRDLDLGRYIDDLEIQHLIRTVQKRISDLNRDGDFRSETEAARNRRLADDDHGQQPTPSMGVDHQALKSNGHPSEQISNESNASEDAVERLVEESLSNFKQIHSRSSLRNVIDSMEKKRNSVEARNSTDCLETTGVRDLHLNELPEPKIVEVDGNHIGRNRADKQAAHISTLPYLHRNPAV